MAVHEGEALQDTWPQHSVLALRLRRVLVLVLRPPEVLPIEQLLDQLAHLAIVEANDGEVVDKCLMTLIKLNESALHLLRLGYKHLRDACFLIAILHLKGILGEHSSEGVVSNGIGQNLVSIVQGPRVLRLLASKQDITLSSCF